MRVALTAIVSALVVAGLASAQSRPDAYMIPGDRVFPEGVAFQPQTGLFYVTSTDDGTVFFADMKDEEADEFLPPGGDGRTTAIGLEVDGDRLFVAGGATGLVTVYDTDTRALLGRFETGPGGFLNDIATARNGDAFVTDSLRPVLWRISADLSGIEPWLDFTGTPFEYLPGFNANGIVATPDGKYLIVSQSNAQKLFRIDLDTKEVVEIVTTEPVGGDGLQLQGRRLFAVAGGAIVKVKLSGDFLEGRVESRTTDPSWLSPTTNAIARGRMLLVNSQFARRNAGLPPILPFTVSSLEIP
jgi:DNA-binding beta-propeller fold protein YncE